MIWHHQSHCSEYYQRARLHLTPGVMLRSAIIPMLAAAKIGTADGIVELSGKDFKFTTPVDPEDWEGDLQSITLSGLMNKVRVVER